MPRIQIIGEPEVFITELAFILRVHGDRELARRVNAITPHNLLRLLPDSGNKSLDEQRALVTRAVNTRLDRLNGFQAVVDEWMHRPDLDEEKEDRAADRRLVLGHDDTNATFGGGKRVRGKRLRDLARMSFKDRKREIAKENKEWERSIAERNKTGLG